MKRYLVTGAAGFIGANFLKYLLKKYEEDIYVVVLDKLTYAGNLGTIKDEIADSRVRFVKGDIRNAELVANIFAETDIDYVVNFAAESHVDRSIANPQLFLETNILEKIPKGSLSMPRERNSCKYRPTRSTARCLRIISTRSRWKLPMPMCAKW